MKMTELQDIIQVKKVSPDQDGSVMLEEYNTNVDMSVKLTGLGPKCQVYRFEDCNPIAELSPVQEFEVDRKKVKLRMICDYLIMFNREGVICPVFIELAKTSREYYPRKKLEQLFSSIKIIDLFTSLHTTFLNGKEKIDKARFLLLYQTNAEDNPRQVHERVVASKMRPRVVMRAKEVDNKFETLYYGGRNKVIKVAKRIVGSNNTISSDDIFLALPTAIPNKSITARLKRGYLRLVEINDQA